MSKEIRYAGFSVLADGTYKFRTASDQRRIDQLIGFGEQVSMILLDRPAATKSEAAKALLAQKDGWLPEAVELFVKTAQDDNPFKPARKKPQQKKLFTVRSQTVRIKPATEKFDWDAPMTPKQAAKIRAEFMKKLKAVYEAN